MKNKCIVRIQPFYWIYAVKRSILANRVHTAGWTSSHNPMGSSITIACVHAHAAGRQGTR